MDRRANSRNNQRNIVHHREDIKRLNDKLTLIFTGVGVVAGVKSEVLWPALCNHPIAVAICLLLGVAPLQEFSWGHEKALWVIHYAKFALLWLVVLLAFFLVIGKGTLPAWLLKFIP
jgi:hypothetical protein